MRALLLIAGFTCIAACGGTTALSTSTGDPCTDEADAICNLRSSCSKGEYVTQSYGDLAACVARTKMQCEASINAPDSNKTPAAVEACAKAYVGFSCASYFDGAEPTACMFVGSRASGATCAFAAQCSSGFCAGTKVASCGTCAAARKRVRPASRRRAIPTKRATAGRARASHAESRALRATTTRSPAASASCVRTERARP